MPPAGDPETKRTIGRSLLDECQKETEDGAWPHAVRILWTLFTWLNTKQKGHIECNGSATILIAVRLHGRFRIQLLASVLLHLGFFTFKFLRVVGCL